MSDYCDAKCKDYFLCTITIPKTELEEAETFIPCPIYSTVMVRTNPQDTESNTEES